ncbi:MAG: ADP-ribosylglycohydrolase family protein [Planctomycetaceae bacterium]|jgi:ADP-ribosylglycohydrolase|nr:ADP-ribosylglycohydrolase family protein [Planctomycetaceae bacterium]
MKTIKEATRREPVRQINPNTGKPYADSEAGLEYIETEMHGARPYKMVCGAVIGDICGSVYEWDNHKTDNPEEIDLLNPRCYFTDDTVLTVAVMEAVTTDHDYTAALRKWGNKYLLKGYGGRFKKWLGADDPQPYNSYGNGSAMRVSPVAWALYHPVFSVTLTRICNEAKQSAECTHNHPEGIKGAQSVAEAIWLARYGWSKEEIKTRIEKCYGYNLHRSLADIRKTYKFDETCQGSVPEAFIAFLESNDFVSTLQNAISIGGDSDTIAAIAGSIAEAYYKAVPQELFDFANERLPEEMRKILSFEG